MLITKKVQNSQLYTKHIKGHFVPVDIHKMQNLTLHQILSIGQTSLDLSFLSVNNDSLKAKYTTVGTKEFFDTITDSCLIENTPSVDSIEDENSNDWDLIALGLRDSGVIALVQFNPIVEDFEILQKIRLDLDEGKIVTPYHKLFAYKNKLLFGFAQVGCMKVWNIEDLENISEVELTYRQIEILSGVLGDDHNNDSQNEEKIGSHIKNRLKNLFSGLGGFFGSNTNEETEITEESEP